MWISPSWQFHFKHRPVLRAIFGLLSLPFGYRLAIFYRNVDPEWQNHIWLCQTVVHAAIFRVNCLRKKHYERKIQKQAKPDGNSDEWAISEATAAESEGEEVDEWVVSHGDVFSLELFELCNQNLLWHQPYNSIYPCSLSLFSISLSLSLSHLLSVMLNEQQCCHPLFQSVCWWVRSSGGGFHLLQIH